MLFDAMIIPSILLFRPSYELGRILKLQVLIVWYILLKSQIVFSLISDDILRIGIVLFEKVYNECSFEVDNLNSNKLRNQLRIPL